MSSTNPTIAVVIPTYKVRKHILNVISRIGPAVSRIYVVDDCCPDGSGAFVENNCNDQRVIVLRTSENQGVGGAVMLGYTTALADKFDIIVKIDGDGQMDPRLIPTFVAPIMEGAADYTKGNRFFDLDEIQSMPRLRLFGNAALSFVNKLSSGYWDLFDPTNGYTAIHRDIACRLPFNKLHRNYFFETDMLFRLNTLRAVIVDIPMTAHYDDEVSNLKISLVLSDFVLNHIRNFCKRIFYNYYLRDMSIASLELPAGLISLTFGILFGGWHWGSSWRTGLPATAGTVMLSAVAILVGFQFLLAFLAYDISSVPRRSLRMSDARNIIG